MRHAFPRPAIGAAHTNPVAQYGVDEPPSKGRPAMEMSRVS